MDRESARQDRIGDRDRSDALARIVSAAGGADSVAAVLAAVADEVVSLVGDGCHVALVGDDGRHLRSVAVRHRRPAIEILLRETLGASEYAVEQGPIGAAVLACEPVLVPVVDAAWRDAVGDDDLGGVMCVPLVVDGDAVGVLLAMRASAGPVFDAEDLALLEEIGMWAALALGSGRSVRRTRGSEAARERPALYDPVTRLPNPVLFREHLRHAYARRGGETVSPVLLVAALEGLEQIYAAHGRTVADRVLADAAARVVSSVGPKVTVGRIDSDRFGLLFEDVEEPEMPVRAAEDLRALLARPIDVGADSLATTASIGIAYARQGRNDTPEDLLAHAYSAQEAARRGGGDRYVVFDRDLGQLVERRLRTEADLRRGLDNDEFTLLYQPEVHLATGETVAVEALLRWRHPERGLLEPRDFLQAAEDSGLLVPIGAWVLEEACRRQAEWTRHRRGRPAPAVVVNLSPRQMRDPDIIADVAGVMDRAGVEAGALCLDVTETALVDDPVAALAALQAFRRFGIRVAVDDFGTGYASLSIVRSFLVDAVKIDRSVVAGLETDPAASGLCSAVVELAAGCGLDVCAEGVETPGQRDRLAALGATRAQGDLFRPACPPDELGLALTLVPD